MKRPFIYIAALRRSGSTVLSESLQRVGRWQREPDAALRQEAQQMVEFMAAYCQFWGYE